MRTNQNLETRDFGVSVWTAPTLLNSWVDYGSTHTDAAYCKDSNGFVYLRGLIKDGTIGTNVFVLPTGFRPQNDLFFVTIANNAIARLIVTASTGAVTASTGSNVWYSLNIPPFSVK